MIQTNPHAEVLAIVPMRHDSERVQGKNRRSFLGRPLYHRIIETLAASERVNAIAVDTDSDEILSDVASAFPQVLRVERPVTLRGGEVPMHDVLRHTIAQAPASLYLQMHATTPLLRAATIDAAIDAFRARTVDADSLLGVTRWQTRLYDDAGFPINHDPAELQRTQDLPAIYEDNSTMYLFDGVMLEKSGRRIGERPLFFEIDRIEAMDIDTETDWQLAELAARAGLGAAVDWCDAGQHIDVPAEGVPA
ncbi:MAG: acylneuraminate cytidylyltransferase family protein [Planctomycetota bacterium]